jgi:hypothetical protein
MQAIPFIIFKGSPAPEGKPCGGKNTITYEIHHNLPDQWGNHYPNSDKVYITCAKTANSSGVKTIEYLDEVFFPHIGANDRDLQEPAGLVLDAFRGHYAKEVKAVTVPMTQLSWLIMDGGITPKAQPLDVLINKVFKGLFRDLFEEWTLSAPINDKTGHPCAPSRQLLVQWVVQAWEKIPTDLIKKAWTVSGYKKFSDLEASNTGDIVQYSPQELGTIIENLTDDNFVMAFQDEMNDPDPEFPEDEEDTEEGEEGDEEEENSSEKEGDEEEESSSEEEEEERQNGMSNYWKGILHSSEEEEEEEESSSEEEEEEEEKQESDSESEKSDGESLEEVVQSRRSGRSKRNAGSYKQGPARFDRRKISFLVA